jgi:hypothetical protein
MSKFRKVVVCGPLVMVVFLLMIGCHSRDAAKVKQAMNLLQQKTAALGTPSLMGTEYVADKLVPALYFGAVEMNNNFTIVDEVQQQMGGTATLFVKSGTDYVRVATNVKNADGSRAIGTMLDPNGPVMAAIQGGTGYSGQAQILGKIYETSYEPIRDGSGQVIGIYYVGYEK